MAKRTAEKQITQENYEESDEVVEAGTFQKASEEDLQNRPIKRAKRRSTASTGNSASPFAAFSGLTSTKTPSIPTFSFLPKAPSVNGAKDSSKQGSSSDCASKLSTKVAKQESNTSRDLEYFRLLKILNENILDWVQRHLEKTPYCDFTPAFNDYEKYVQDLEKRFPPREDGTKKDETASEDVKVVKNSGSTSTNMQPTASTSSTIAQPTIPEPHSVTPAKSASSTPLTFGSKSPSGSGLLFGTAPLSASPAGFTFGLNSTSSSSNESELNKPSAQASGFSFSLSAAGQASGVKSFSFASAAPPKPKEEEEEQNTEGDDENEEPPKEPYVPFEEEGAVYSKRCKLFYKKEGSFVEKGVGMLHIKPLEGKTQLLVRAENSVGTVLLNISLISSIPVSRTGKNNVLIVCIPNPPMDSSGDGPEAKALPLLIRVKTSEDADELLQKINEYKC